MATLSSILAWEIPWTLEPQRMRWLVGNRTPSGHEFEQTLGGSDGQGSLACCSPWGHKQVDTNEAT